MKHERGLMIGVIVASIVAGTLLVSIIAVALTCRYFKHKQERNVDDLNHKNTLLEGEKAQLEEEKLNLKHENLKLQKEKREAIQKCKDERVIDHIEDMMRGFERIESYSDDKRFHKELEEFVEKAKKVIQIVRTQTDSDDSLQVHEEGFHQIKIVTMVLKCLLEAQIKK